MAHEKRPLRGVFETRALYWKSINRIALQRDGCGAGSNGGSIILIAEMIYRRGEAGRGAGIQLDPAIVHCGGALIEYAEPHVHSSIGSAPKGGARIGDGAREQAGWADRCAGRKNGNVRSIPERAAICIIVEPEGNPGQTAIIGIEIPT